MTKKQFKEGPPPLVLDFGGNSGRFCVARQGKQIITVEEADLDVEQAQALRDWLNSVLPDEPTVERGPDFRALSMAMGNPCLEPRPDESFEAALVRLATERLSENRNEV